MKRNIILGLHPVDWSDGNRQGEFVWSVVSALGALGETFDYDYVTAVSGTAFRTSFAKEGFNHGNYHIVNVMFTIPHTFKMLGYDIAIYERNDFETDKKLIINSIDKGIPVLTIEGVVNCSECCVISGYDNDGNVLLGYNPFMYVPDDHNEPHDETGYFRKTNWHDGFFADGTGGKIIIINGATEKPTNREIYLETIKLGIKLISLSQTSLPLLSGGNFTLYNGLSAHTAFANALTNLNGDDIFTPYLNICCNMKMYQDKKYATAFLRNAKTELAEYSNELEQAAACYDKIGSLRDVLGTLIREDFSEIDKIGDKDVMKQYADVLLEIRGLEEKAMNQLKKVVLKNDD